MMNLNDLLNQIDKQPEQLLPELKRIRCAVELSAALHAHVFFKAQGSSRAAERLASMIENLTAQLCKKQ